jgi:glucose-1-phosphate thymidylyltransferase
VICAGGKGTRLKPLTNVVNKHLLSVYDRPMIFWSLLAMKTADIEDVLIVAGGDSIDLFMRLLGSGRSYGLDITYRVQDEPNGITQQVNKFRTFADTGLIVTTQVADPSQYGVCQFDSSGNLVRVLEKPTHPPSQQIVTGCYGLTPEVFDVITTLKPSRRGELEITDVINWYLSNHKLLTSEYEGCWIDIGGSYDSLLDAAFTVRELQRHNANII